MSERTVIFKFEYPYSDEDWPRDHFTNQELVEESTETLFQFLLEGGDVEHNVDVIDTKVVPFSQK